jgi:peptidyl-prolyl cis-trans isomerase SurA
MTSRFLALFLAAVALATSLGAAAQGLRPTPQLAPSRPAARDAGPRPADYIVAVVNSEPITNNEVRTRMLRFEQQLAQQGSAMPPRAQLAREVLERLITEKAQLQVARETGVRADDALVDAAEQNIARQNSVTLAELRRRMAAEGIDVGQFREDLRNQIMLQRLRDRELDQRVKVTDLDIEQYLREQEQDGAGDPALTELNLAHILVAVPEAATPEQVAQAEAKAQQLLQRARSGDDFSRLAR